MDLKKTIVERIKPELNQLYYEDNRPDTIFCREHSFHIYILCRALGIPAGIQNGNFSVHGHRDRRQHSGEHSDGRVIPDGHYWNRIGQEWPIDTSISFRGCCVPEEDIGLVYETDYNNVFTVIKTTDSEAYDEIKKTYGNTKTICYRFHSDLEPDPCDLLSDPYSLLIQEPAPWRPLTADYGPEIFDKITLHLIKVATGKTPALYPKQLDFNKALGIIQKKHKNARRTLLQMIKYNSEKH